MRRGADDGAPAGDVEDPRSRFVTAMRGAAPLRQAQVKARCR